VGLGFYGLVPKWKIPPGEKHYATMNVRAETVGEKPTYWRAWLHGKHCLVPMLGFFSLAMRAARPSVGGSV